MRRSWIALFIAAVSTTALTHVALAADIAVKAPPPAPAPVTNWTGWYAGINFGGGWGTSNNATTTVTPFDDLAQFFPRATPSGSLAGANSGTASLNQAGPIGGVQIGYNWQLAPLWVLGFEADIQGAAITSDRAGNTGFSRERFAGTSLFTKSVNTATSAEALAASFTNAAITASGFNSITADLNWFGTVRGRVGYLFTPNLLFYVTGGLAYGGVKASASDTLNLDTLTADSFAVAFGLASGPGAAAAAAATTTSNTASAAATASTTNITTASAADVIRVPPSAAAALSINLTGPGTSATFAQSASVGPPVTAANIIAASAPGQTVSNFTHATTPLSVALAQTGQSFVHVSDTKVGGTIGGGFEWMMAPNWSVKAEALYYDLGSVTISTPITTSINPITAAIPATVAGTSTAGVTGAINRFTGAATVSNVATTHINFQGVIIRLGLNYHFNFL